MTESEYGPWINHDGKGCPVVGMWVHVVSFKGDEAEGVVQPACNDPKARKRSRWFWRDYVDCMAIDGVKKYRIRKPRGMSILLSILSEVERGGGKGYDVDRVKEGVNA